VRPLIYLCSFGPAVYSEMARLCVRSLRRFGRYAGPIIVFTNNGFRGSDNKTQVVEIPDRLSHFATRTFKAKARQYIDGSKHNVVMSIDTDMLAVRDINPLLTYRHERTCGMREIPWTRMSDRSCNACLRQTERRLARSRWGINGGLLCTPGHLYERYMRAWEAECVNHRHRLRTWVNQPALNALILRRDIQFTAYPRRWIEMPPLYHLRQRDARIQPSTRILHFCWPSKTLSLIEMESAWIRLQRDHTSTRCGQRHA
jgi:hypothetical protein